MHEWIAWNYHVFCARNYTLRTINGATDSISLLLILLLAAHCHLLRRDARPFFAKNGRNAMNSSGSRVRPAEILLRTA
jgi:hypothetical protein